MGTSDRLTYRWASLSLRAGMYTSFGAMSIGLVWWLAAGGHSDPTTGGRVVEIERIIPELLAGNPLALINLGVLLLLATPGVTLLTAIVTYAIEGNRRFVGISSLIGLVLLLSLALSFRWITLF
jgi:uncharacterized membrane protein